MELFYTIMSTNKLWTFKFW